MFCGERLKNMRKLKNLSQKKLGVLTGIPQTTISDIERNKISPNVVRLFKIAKVLEVPISEIIEERKV